MEANSIQLSEISTVSSHYLAKSGDGAEEHWIPVDNELDELVGLVQLIVNMNNGRCKESPEICEHDENWNRRACCSDQSD